MAERITEYFVVEFKGLTSKSDEESTSKTKNTKSALTTGLEGLQKALSPIRTATAHTKDEPAGDYFLKEIGKNNIEMISNVADYSISRYFRLSEDYRSEYYLNNVMGNINRAKSFTMSTLSGAIRGSKFGPIGAAVGATISAATTGVNQWISYQKQIDSYEQSLNATRVETAFRAQRAGLYDGGKGTEN